MPNTRELKHRYRMLMAAGDALPVKDQGVRVPLSTGSPFLDSMLNEQIKATDSMREEEHLIRSWQLVRGASDREIEIAMNNLGGCLNDHKMLLAVRMFMANDPRFEKVLRSMPNKWRLMFPTAIIKPSAVFLTGWRGNIRFRLVEDEIPWDRLKAHFRKTLAHLPDDAPIKYRAIIKEVMALLHWKPECGAEQELHDWCFGTGAGATVNPLLASYVRARDKLYDPDDFLAEIATHDRKIPLTSFMGLLSSVGTNLSLHDGTPYRDYAVSCASPVEGILRFNEWGNWLDDSQIDIMAGKITGRDGANIPFHKVVNAYLMCPGRIRARVFESIYIPLMKGFSQKMAGFIPEGTSVVLMQPDCFVNVMSLLFLTTIAYTRPIKAVLLGDKIRELDTTAELNYDTLKEVMMGSKETIQRFFLEKFGGAAISTQYTFAPDQVASAFDLFNPDDLLILDMPFMFSTKILERMLPMDRILNLGTNLGSPSEIPINVDYEKYFAMETVRGGIYAYRRYADTAVSSLSGFIERLEWFSRAGGEFQ